MSSWRAALRFVTIGAKFEVGGAGTDSEVFASSNEGQITVRAGKSDEDFEDFGRGLTDEQVAQQAFSRLIELLDEYGYIAD